MGTSSRMPFTVRRVLFLCVIFLYFHAVCGKLNVTDHETKRKRQFSLFTIVTFPNDQCTTTSSTTTKGTCLTSTECSSKSGSSDGNCASGFGVCCLFKTSTCGSTVTENCTYVQNPGYSSSYTTSGSCSFSVTPINSNICQIRLDFDKFVTTISTKGACTDSFIATGPTNTNGLNTLCGTLTDQHLYLEQGRSTSSSTLAFTLATTTTGATFNIKVSQIECSSTFKAPTDCMQYLTGASGFVTSYGWIGSRQIAGQDTTHCIRRESGYCEIEYWQAQGTSIDSFILDVGTTKSELQALAAADDAFINIPGVSVDTNGSFMDGFTGSALAKTDDVTVETMVGTSITPFIIKHTTSSTVTTAGNKGFKLQFQQVPC